MRKLNLVGKQFTNLQVLEEIKERRYGKVYWKCECICGKITEVPGSHLIDGDTKSCGCYSHNKMSEYKKLIFGKSSFNYMYRGYKSSAKRRGFEFRLSEDEFKEITQKDCHYCGEPPRQYYKRIETFGRYIHNGIDRVNNELGYIPDNCVPCCKRCNRMKEQMTQIDFFSHMKRILKHCGEVS